MKISLTALLVIVCSISLAGGSSAARDSASRASAGPRFMEPWSPPDLPQAFQISPLRQSGFLLIGGVYNPVLDRHIVFLFERTAAADNIYSRQLNPKGQPASAWQKIWENEPDSIGETGLGYNGRDNTIFMVGTDGADDQIYGLALDGRGLPRGGKATPFIIKPKSGEYTAGPVRVVWLPASNQFVVQWSCILLDAGDARNGQYLAVYDRNFKKVIGPRLVRQQTMVQGHPAFLLPLEDKILWGSADDAPGGNVKPVVWFTDFKGRVLTNYGANGLIYPGGTLKSLGYVQPALDQDHGIVLLSWNSADNPSQGSITYLENCYRMMDTGGVFKSAVLKIPKREAFQMQPLVQYVQSEKRFFLVCSEYKIMSSQKPLRQFFGGKLWGFYMDERGRLEDKQGNYVVAPIPLTMTFLDPTIGMIPGGLTFRAKDKSFLITYMIIYLSSEAHFEDWGLIYK